MTKARFMVGILAWKELQVGTATRRMVLARVVTNSALLLVLLLGMARFLERPGDFTQVARYGRDMFTLFAWTLTAALLLLGPALSIGAVSAERRKDTLDMLFLAGFAPAEVVLGKTLARLASMALLVLSTLPIFLFVYAYGGVSPVELAAVYVTALCAAAWSTALGILLSVLTEDGTTAMVGSVCWIAFYCGLPFTLGQSLDTTAWTAWFGPLSFLQSALGNGLLREADLALGAPWMVSNLVLLAQAAGFVAAGAFLLPRLSSGGLNPGAALARAARALEPLIPGFVPTSAQLLTAEGPEGRFNPFTWREVYGRSFLGLRSVAVLVGLVLAAMLVSYRFLGGVLSDPEFHLLFTCGMVAVGLLIVNALAASSIAAEKENKSLEVFAQVAHVKYRYVFGKFYGLLWVSSLLCLPPLLHTTIFGIAGKISLLVPLVALLTLPLAMGCTIAHGLYCSLRCRTEAAAVAASTLTLILFLVIQFTLGHFFPPVFLLNPAYGVAACLWFAPTTREFPCVALLLLPLYHPLVLKLNLWYIHTLLVSAADRFDASLVEHLEGGAGGPEA